MQHFELTDKELEVLREVLEQNLNEIETEISRTDTHAFKLMLKSRKETLEHLLSRLPAASLVR
jgi:hypothetical protein